MNNILELQELWSSQKTERKHVLTKNKLPGFIKRLKKYERFQNRINILKVVGIAASLIPFTLIMTKYTRDSVLLTIGFIGVIISTLSFMAYYFKNQFKLSQLDFTEHPTQFAQRAIQNLTKQIKVFRLPFTLFAVSLLLCINIIYYQLTSDSDITTRIGLHAGVSTFMTIIFYLGLKVRFYRIKNETQPIINDLEQFINKEQ